MSEVQQGLKNHCSGWWGDSGAVGKVLTVRMKTGCGPQLPHQSQPQWQQQVPETAA